jgi:peptidoglycan/LPS O-acetylase OafA/YrhL
VVEKVSNFREKAAFRGDLEGLRGVVVLLVVAFHFGVPGFSGGFIGVDVFFVLSGYLITGLLRREYALTHRISLRDFYARRIRRILPAATLVALATAAAVFALVSPIRWKSVAEDLVFVSFSLGNFHFASQATEYFNKDAQPSPLLHMWSLGVEEQFYLLWPILLLVLLAFAFRRTRATETAFANRLVRLTLLSIMAIALTVSLFQTTVSQPDAFFGLQTRAFELGAGALSAFIATQSTRVKSIARSNLLGFLGVALLGVSLAKLGGVALYPSAWMILPVVGTVLLLHSDESLVSRFLSVRPLRAVGRWSYSLYLWHWPLFALASQNVFNQQSLHFASKVVLALVAILLSALSYKFIESPFRNSELLRKSLVRTYGAGAGMVATSLLVALVLACLAPLAKPGRVQLPSSAAQVAAAVKEAAQYRGPVPKSLNPSLESTQNLAEVPQTKDCLVESLKAGFRPCIFGVRNAFKTLWLVGDSHAAHWFPAIEKIALANHLKLVAHTHTACSTLLPQNSLQNIQANRSADCVEWTGKVNAAIRRAQPNLIIVAGADGITNNNWEAYLNELRFLKRNSGNLVALGDSPKSVGSRPICLAYHLMDSQSCHASRNLVVDGTDFALLHKRIAQKIKSIGVNYVDASDWLCYRNECPSVIGNLLVYVDETHLSWQAGMFFAPAVANALQRYLP